MRTEKEILDVLAALKKRKEFKMLALLWVLGEIDKNTKSIKSRKNVFKYFAEYLQKGKIFTGNNQKYYYLYRI